MTDQLPQNWEKWPLADVGQWLGGGTPSSSNPAFWDGNIPWVSPKDMKVSVITSTQDRITEKAIEESAAKLISAHSVLFVTRSGILAHSFPVATTGIAVTVNQDLKAIIPVEVVAPDYLAWALRYLERHILHSCTKHGTTVHSVQIPALKSLKIPVPPHKEQRRIVARVEELFSQLDKGIEALTTAREQLEAYRQSVLKHAFEGRLSAKWRATRATHDQLSDHFETIPDAVISEFPALPDGWRYLRLGAFIERIEAGKSFKCDEHLPGPNEIGVAKVSAVTWGEYDENESKTCKDSTKVNADYFIREGDFLFSRANTLELVGACVIAKSVNSKVMLSDKTLRIVFSFLSPRYFLYYLRSRTGRKEIMRLSTGNQESMRNIGQDRIRNILVPACPPAEAEYIQDRIHETLSSVDQVAQEIETQLAKTLALRQSILKQAFSGQLLAQDPTDEPASVLLERIRAEMEPAKGQKEFGRKKKEAA